MKQHDVAVNAAKTAQKTSQGLGKGAIAGVVAGTFGAAAIVIAFGGPSDQRSARVGPVGSLELTQLSIEDLPAALETVAPEQRAAVEQEIRACRRLAAMMSISSRPAIPATATTPEVVGSGMVQIKSGDYLSPPFMVGAYPVKILVPMPALAPVLNGQMEVIGIAQNVRVEMTPPLDLSVLKGNVVQNVHWFADQPCAVSG